MSTMQNLETMFTAAVFAEANDHDYARTLVGSDSGRKLLEDYFCAASFAEENCHDTARSIANIPDMSSLSLSDVFTAATFAEQGHVDTALSFVEDWNVPCQSSADSEKFLEDIGLKDLPVQYMLVSV